MMPARNAPRPAPDGESLLLVEFPRGPRNDPGAEVLRWSLDTFTPNDGGRAARYVSARIWFRGQDGELHPTRRGVTIRAGELVAVVKALCGAARSLGLLPQKGAPSHA
jgi:hypothetical protein